MAERYVGPGKASRMLDRDDSYIRRLRRQDRFPAPEVEIHETAHVRVGWRHGTIEAVGEHLARPDEVPLPVIEGPPARYVGMTRVAPLYGFTETRGYQLVGRDDFPSVAAELEEPKRVHFGFDEAEVEANKDRLNRTPGRPRKQTDATASDGADGVR